MVGNRLLRMNLQFFAEPDESGGHATLEDLDPKQEEQQEEKPALGLDEFKQFAETNPEAKAWLTQTTQAKIDKGVQTMFENKKEELEQQAMLKASNLTPEQKEIANIKLEMQKIKDEKAISDNRALVLQELNEFEIDSSVKPYLQSFALDLVDVDPNKTTGMLQNLTQIMGKLTDSTQRTNTMDSVQRMNQSRESAQPTQKQEQQQSYLDPTQRGRDEIGKAIWGS